MKAIRITFKNEDFALVSRNLVDLGIVFHVEPIEEPVTSGMERSAATNIRATKKQQPRKSAKPAPTALGAATLRNVVERNRVTTGERLPTAGIPEDLSEKLLPYTDRPDAER
jgi:hypothetical protein